MEETYRVQLRKGMLTRALLSALRGSELYVAELLTRLDATEFATQEGTLYPLLARLRRENLVSHRWEESESGPPRKYYTLTSDGKALLAQLETYQATLEDDLKNLGVQS